MSCEVPVITSHSDVCSVLRKSCWSFSCWNHILVALSLCHRWFTVFSAVKVAGQLNISCMVDASFYRHFLCNVVIDPPTKLICAFWDLYLIGRLTEVGEAKCFKILQQPCTFSVFRYYSGLHVKCEQLAISVSSQQFLIFRFGHPALWPHPANRHWQSIKIHIARPIQSMLFSDKL